MERWWFLSAALALASCGAPARATRPGTLVARGRPSPIPSCQDLHAGGGPRACAIATFDPDAASVDVFLRVEPEALPAERESVTVAFGDEVRELGAVAEPVELRYSVALESRDEPGSSFRHATGWHLLGRSFLPQIRVDGELVAVPATLLLEVGDAPLYSSAGPTPRVFDAASFARLSEEAFEVGPIPLSRREVDGDTLWVAGIGRGDGELEVSADALASAYRQVHELLGDAPADSLLLVLHPPAAEPWSEGEGTSIVWALPSSTDPEAALADRLRPLVQLFLPSAEPWIREGVASYLAIQVGAELLELDPTATARALLDGHVTRGATAAYCLDGYLRRRSSSLGAWLRRARGAGSLDAEALLADLGAVFPEGAGYLAALLDAEGEPAIEECLDRAGLRADTEELEGPTDAALREALGVVAWRPLDALPVLRVDGVEADSPLQRGDLLLSVADQPIGDADDLAWAIRDATPGSQVTLRVRRRGDVSEIAWPLPALDDAFDEGERASRPHLVVVPVDAAAP